MEESDCSTKLALFPRFFSSFLQAELTMCNRNHHTNGSLKLACFDAAKDGRSGIYELRSTTGWTEAVFVYYRAARGVDKPVGWLIDPEGFAPKSPVAGDRAHKHP